MKRKEIITIVKDAFLLANKASKKALSLYGDVYAYRGFVRVNVNDHKSKLAHVLMEEFYCPKGKNGGVDIDNPGGLPVNTFLVKKAGAEAFVKYLQKFFDTQIITHLTN